MKTLKLLFLSFFLIGGISISVAQNVVTDYDKDLDFSKYTSVSFLGWQEDEGEVLNDFDKKRFMDAFKEEMEKRNLKLVESNGDMSFALYVVADQKTSTSAYTNYYGGGARRGYHRGGRGGWGGGHSTTSYTESEYLQGTLVMDVFDVETKDQIWQSVATKTVNEKPEKRDKSIPKGVKKIMKNFPIKPAK